MCSFIPSNANFGRVIERLFKSNEGHVFWNRTRYIGKSCSCFVQIVKYSGPTCCNFWLVFNITWFFWNRIIPILNYCNHKKTWLSLWHVTWKLCVFFVNQAKNWAFAEVSVSRRSSFEANFGTHTCGLNYVHQISKHWKYI